MKYDRLKADTGSKLAALQKELDVLSKTLTVFQETSGNHRRVSASSNLRCIWRWHALSTASAQGCTHGCTERFAVEAEQNVWQLEEQVRLGNTEIERLKARVSIGVMTRVHLYVPYDHYILTCGRGCCDLRMRLCNLCECRAFQAVLTTFRLVILTKCISWAQCQPHVDRLAKVHAHT